MVSHGHFTPWKETYTDIQHTIRAIKFIISDSIAHKQCILVRELERVIYESWWDGFTWSPYPMRGHIPKHTIRALKYMESGSPTNIWSILVREYKRVIYGSCIRIVWHSHPTPQRGCIYKHTTSALKIIESGFPAYIWYIKVRTLEPVIYRKL